MRDGTLPRGGRVFIRGTFPRAEVVCEDSAAYERVSAQAKASPEALGPMTLIQARDSDDFERLYDAHRFAYWQGKVKGG